jgi:hypothetical protein
MDDNTNHYEERLSKTSFEGPSNFDFHYSKFEIWLLLCKVKWMQTTNWIYGTEIHGSVPGCYVKYHVLELDLQTW